MKRVSLILPGRFWLRWILLAWVEGQAAFAQSPQAPGRLGAAASGLGSVPAVVKEEEEMVAPDTIQFPNNPVADFLRVYERLKEVPLILDATLLQGGANLSLSLNQPVSREDAIRLIESTLLLNGYAFIAVDNPNAAQGPGPATEEVAKKPFAIKVINTAGGKNARSEGVFLAQRPEELPTGEVITSFVMQLEHLPAGDAVPIFEQFITLHPYGSIVSVPLSNQVLITENSTLIRRLLEVKKLVDLPQRLEKKFIQLEQANADRVVEIITQILEKRAEGRAGGDGARAATGQPAQVPGLPPSPAAPSATLGGSTAASVGDIQLIADTRTNRILVIADESSLKFIEALIEDFDKAVLIGDPYVQLLNYVAASDMLPILADILQEEGDEGGDAGAAGGGVTRTTTSGIGTGATTGTGATGGVSGAGRLGSLQEPGEEQAAQSIIVGKTRLIADNRANAILVIGQPEAREKVRAILDKLDKRPMQVYLATVIGQLRVNNDDSFAVNILQKYIGGPQTGAASVAGGRPFISSGTNGVTPLSPAAASLATMAQVASAALPGMQIATFIAGSIDLYIQALTATTRFRIASRPSVFTANNKKAVIFNGKKIAVPTSTVTTLGAGGSATATSGSQQSNIQYQDVVLKIEVVPLINSAREITLQIIQTNDNVIPGQNTNIGGGVSVPEIATQELTTTVTVPDRSTILLGGLITQEDSKTTAGVPFLSSIPLMGNLFKSTSDITRREELVVMIQPSVIQDVPEMREVSKTERDLTGFSSKELSPLSMKVGAKTTAPDIAPLSAPEELPAPPAQE
jgi:type II secretion system protein D